jgi:putative hydrolase
MGPQGWPFGQGFDFNEVMRMLQTPGPVNWELARRIAAETSGIDRETGQPAIENPIAATERDHIVDIVRAAQTHIANATSLSSALGLSVDVVDRAEWARRTLVGLEPVMVALAEAISPDASETLDPEARPFGDLPEGENPFAGTPFEALGPDMMAGMMSALSPVLLGWLSGALTGLLAQFALGQYDLALPLAGVPALTFVASNIESFGRDWSLSATDLRFALALREVVHGAQRSVPWVRERLLRLSSEFVRGYELQPDALEQQFAAFTNFDPTTIDPANLDPATFDPATFDPATLAGLEAIELPDPGTLLDAMQTPQQRPVLEELQRFAAVLEGYADTVVDMVGEPLVPSLRQIEEALRRHRVDRGRAADFVDRMLGLELGREHYEQGQTFCQGVVERGGLEALDRLWESEAMVPTPNEIDAPGLWLARIELQ